MDVEFLRFSCWSLEIHLSQVRLAKLNEKFKGTHQIEVLSCIYLHINKTLYKRVENIRPGFLKNAGREQCTRGNFC